MNGWMGETLFDIDLLISSLRYAMLEVQKGKNS
jgi:hypothetical protein